MRVQPMCVCKKSDSFWFSVRRFCSELVPLFSPSTLRGFVVNPSFLRLTPAGDHPSLSAPRRTTGQRSKGGRRWRKITWERNGGMCVKVCVCAWVSAPWKNILQTRSLRGSYRGRGAGEESAAAGVKLTSWYVYLPLIGHAVHRLIWRCCYTGYISDWHHKLRSTGPTAVPLCCFVKRTHFPTNLFSGKHHQVSHLLFNSGEFVDLSWCQPESFYFLMLHRSSRSYIPVRSASLDSTVCCFQASILHLVWKWTHSSSF